MQNAIEPWSKPHYRSYLAALKRSARKHKLRLDVPWSVLTDEEKRFVLEGGEDFDGVRGFFKWLERKKYKVHVLVFLSRYRGYLTCPECQGGIWEIVEQGVAQYRCRVGHAYTAETFVTEQATRVENALWTALRALEERAAVHRRIAARQRERGNTKSAARSERKADHSVENAVVLRELLRQFVAHEGAA